MASETKIYKINDIIRHNESGELDKEKSLEIIRKLIGTASYHGSHNILIDLRETTLKGQDLHTLFDLAMEMARYKNIFNNKIANVVPADPERLKTARFFHGCVDVVGIDYQIFTDFEEALDWLSEPTTLNKED